MILFLCHHFPAWCRLLFHHPSILLSVVTLCYKKQSNKCKADVILLSLGECQARWCEGEQGEGCVLAWQSSPVSVSEHCCIADLGLSSSGDCSHESTVRATLNMWRPDIKCTQCKNIVTSSVKSLITSSKKDSKCTGFIQNPQSTEAIIYISYDGITVGWEWMSVHIHTHTPHHHLSTCN